MLANPAAEGSLIRNTLPFNVLGIPAISVPCGVTRAGLPVGLQITGPRLGEARVLALAHAYEQATDWHRREPPLQLVEVADPADNPERTASHRELLRRLHDHLDSLGPKKRIAFVLHVVEGHAPVLEDRLVEDYE